MTQVSSSSRWVLGKYHSPCPLAPGVGLGQLLPCPRACGIWATDCATPTRFNLLFFFFLKIARSVYLLERELVEESIHPLAHAQVTSMTRLDQPEASVPSGCPVWVQGPPRISRELEQQWGQDRNQTHVGSRHCRQQLCLLCCEKELSLTQEGILHAWRSSRVRTGQNAHQGARVRSQTAGGCGHPRPW